MVEWLHISLSLFKNHIAGNDSSLLLVSHFHTSHHGGQAGLKLLCLSSLTSKFQACAITTNSLFPSPQPPSMRTSQLRKFYFFIVQELFWQEAARAE